MYTFRFEAIENLTATFRGIRQNLSSVQSVSNTLRSSLAALSPPVVQLGQEVRRTQAPMNAMRSQLAGINGMVASAFSIYAVQRFGSSIIDTLAEFEKFEAVLKNTLGSGSAAKKVLSDIKDFAVKTPYEVAELSDAYVRLQNRGLKPSMDMMTALGDLAASQGKPFQQVSEAYMDAPVKQFKRLQEALGVNVEAMKGGLLKFDGLGVHKIIKDSPEAITKAVMELAKLPQVAGAMDAISKTTGGMISNLNDQLTNFKYNIGVAFEPFIKGVIKTAIDKIQQFTKFVTDNKVQMMEWAKSFAQVGARALAIFAIVKGYNRIIAIYEFIKTVQTPQLIKDLARGIIWLGLQGLAALSTARKFLTLTNITTTAAMIQVGFAGTLNLLKSKFKDVAAWMNITNIRTAIGGGLMAAYSFVVNGFSKALTFLKNTLSFATLNQIRLNVAMYANPIGLIVLAIAALALAFYGLFKLIDSLFPNFFKTIKEGFMKAFDFIWNNFIKPVKDALSWLFGFTEIDMGVNFALPSEADIEKLMPNLGLVPGADGKDTPTSKGIGVSNKLDDIQSKAPKNVNIVIHKLVERLELHSINMEIGATKIKDEITRILLDAVNDVNHAI